MNHYLWMKDKGYYGQYLYGRSTMSLSPRFEALGEAFSILFGIADSSKARSIFGESPITPYGTTCIYPQIPEIPPYHNNAIWPFVQAFWNIAAAKTGNEEALLQGLAAIYRAGALFLTNYENMVADNGDFNGTEINSDHMLWSMAGNLAMVHRIFIGMDFEPDGIRFQPFIPEVYGGTKTLSNFSYRKAKLDITVKGFGKGIASFKLDGKSVDEPFFSGNLKGKHRIEIELDNNSLGKSKINMVANKFSLTNPLAKIVGKTMVWNVVPDAVLYNIYKDGEKIATIHETHFELDEEFFAEYKVSAVDSENVESFTSEPLWIFPSSDEKIVEFEDFVKKSDLPYTNYSGKGFVKTTMSKNRSISIPVIIHDPGKYLIDISYSNGTGPWNTDNNCAIRSLYVNGKYEGVIVFPQRGQDEWSDWGFSNSREVLLQKGKNQINLNFENWNINMDGKINDAMLDYMRLIKIE
jgi:hypothetical protein